MKKWRCYNVLWGIHLNSIKLGREKQQINRRKAAARAAAFVSLEWLIIPTRQSGAGLNGKTLSNMVRFPCNDRRYPYSAGAGLSAIVAISPWSRPPSRGSGSDVFVVLVLYHLLRDFATEKDSIPLRWQEELPDMPVLDSILAHVERRCGQTLYINFNKSSMSHNAIKLFRSSANFRASLVNFEDVTITDWFAWLATWTP